MEKYYLFFYVFAMKKEGWEGKGILMNEWMYIFYIFARREILGITITNFENMKEIDFYQIFLESSENYFEFEQHFWNSKNYKNKNLNLYI